MTIGVIISTYNNPAWLEKTLWGYLCQDRMADEIIIADDGSGEETRMLIERYKKLLPIKHVWHEDDGFRKQLFSTRLLWQLLLIILFLPIRTVCQDMISWLFIILWLRKVSF